MSNFDWDLNEIKAANKNKNIINALKAEMTKKDDNSITFNHTNFYINKYMYIKELKRLNSIMPILKDVIFKVADQHMNTHFYNIDLDCHDVTADQLLHFLMGFYSFLQDKELLNEYFKLLQNQRKHFRIQKFDEDNPICSHIKGRCVTDKSGNIYLSYYTKNRIDDYTGFTHETAHMITDSLYKNEKNPIFNNYLIEFEARFIEILAMYYLSLIVKEPLAFDIMLNKEISDIVFRAIYIKIQSQIFTHTFAPSTKKMNIELTNLGINRSIPNINQYYACEVQNYTDIINSFLMALDLFVNTNYDFEKAIYEYKQILKDNSQDIMTILDKHNITYPQDGCHNLSKKISEINSKLS